MSRWVREQGAAAGQTQELSLAEMRFRQGVTLGVLWLSYAAIYLLRKPLGVGKSAMAADLDLQPCVVFRL